MLQSVSSFFAFVPKFAISSKGIPLTLVNHLNIDCGLGDATI